MTRGRERFTIALVAAYAAVVVGAYVGSGYESRRLVGGLGAMVISGLWALGGAALVRRGFEPVERPSVPSAAWTFAVRARWILAGTVALGAITTAGILADAPRHRRPSSPSW